MVDQSTHRFTMTVSPIGQEHFIGRRRPAFEAFTLLRAGQFKMITVQIRQPETVVDAPGAPGRTGFVDGGRINDSITIAAGPLALVRSAAGPAQEHGKASFCRKASLRRKRLKSATALIVLRPCALALKTACSKR